MCVCACSCACASVRACVLVCGWGLCSPHGNGHFLGVILGHSLTCLQLIFSALFTIRRSDVAFGYQSVLQQRAMLDLLQAARPDLCLKKFLLCCVGLAAWRSG